MSNVLNKFRLDNKIALVTGSSSGIGMAMSVALAEAGADIIGVSKDMDTKGTEVQKKILLEGRKFFHTNAILAIEKICMLSSKK